MARKQKLKKAPGPTPERCEDAIKNFFLLGGHTKRGALTKASTGGVKYNTLRDWVQGHSTAVSALQAFRQKARPGRKTTMPRDLEAACIRLLIESYQRNASLARGEFARIYNATAEDNGIEFKVRYRALQPKKAAQNH